MERLCQSLRLLQLAFGACDDGVVKRLTAVNRLAGIADELDRSKLWHRSSVVAGYVFGVMLDGASDVERIQIALVVDEPVEDVPWMSHPVHLEALASLLRFDKLPMLWRWRPSGWPVWNHEIIRAVSFWSTTSGRDQAVIDALASGHLDLVQFVEPMDPVELVAQLRTERDVARRHLADAVAGFHEREWRGEHKGGGIYPGDHLWSAAAGFLDLDSAVERLNR
jgi:hypothetical protein